VIETFLAKQSKKSFLKSIMRKDRKKLFVVKPLYQRSLIVAAGPFANFLLAIVIFTFIYMFAG
jgi:regulator of sigma E protease